MKMKGRDVTSKWRTHYMYFIFCFSCCKKILYSSSV